MKNILSISVGSSQRDHTTTHQFLGQECQLSRQGTNGDFNEAVRQYQLHDGKVDAFGVGGAEFYLNVAGKRYYFRDVKRIRTTIRHSKVGDGNGIKNILSKRAFQALETHLNASGQTLRGMKALKTTAVDRYGMAQALVESGCDVTFGDFMFALGIPLPLKTLAQVRLLGAALLPIITNLPYMWLYPLGSEQDKDPIVKWEKYYAEAQVIAGDFLQIRRHMPQDLSGKIIVTNTTTAKNVEELQKRGVKTLVTTTPRLAGRSFGTNVIEATLLALIEKPQDQITQADLRELIDRIPLTPNIETLN
jgi:hypothetical protein